MDLSTKLACRDQLGVGRVFGWSVLRVWVWVCVGVGAGSSAGAGVSASSRVEGVSRFRKCRLSAYFGLLLELTHRILLTTGLCVL